MLELFNKKYRACSNIFAHTVEDNNYIYPAPLSIYATIEDEQRNLKNELKIRVPSYYESILTLDFHFSIFLYLLTTDYHIDTVYIDNLEKVELTSEISGYGGIYGFTNANVLLNIGEEEIYDSYKKTVYN